MLTRFRRSLADFIAPPPMSVRRFDAAAGGRRASGFATFGRTQTEVSGATQIVRSRARGLYANNPFMRAAIDNWIGSLIGTGITPTAEPDALAYFNSWNDVADADSRTDFLGLQAELTRSLVVDGEAFCQILTTDDGIRLRTVPSELVDESVTRDLGGGACIVNGIEFATDGTRLAYWIVPNRPAEAFETYAPAVRVPASEILHIMKPLGIGQVRGISWLAPVAVPANELDAIIDGLAVGVKVAALHAGFLTDLNGTGEPFDGDLTDVSLEPGTLRRLPQGYDIKFHSPQHANETAAFLAFNIRMLAAGLGLPTHFVDGDLSGANYSSLRAGLLPFRARCEQIQYHVIAPQLLNPVWRRVHALSVLSGELDAIPAVEWLPPAWQQVDPLKAVQADVAELEAGLTSRRKLVAARGWSITDLDAEIAADDFRQTTATKSNPPDDEEENGPNV